MVSELMTSLKISSDYTCIQNKCTLRADTEELHLTHFQVKLTELVHQHFLYVEVGIKADTPATCWHLHLVGLKQHLHESSL